MAQNLNECLIDFKIIKDSAVYEKEAYLMYSMNLSIDLREIGMLRKYNTITINNIGILSPINPFIFGCFQI